MEAAAKRPYSIVRLYVPAEQFAGSDSPASVALGLDHDALEAAAIADELPQLLMSAEDRRAQLLERSPVFRVIVEDGDVYVSPEQPEARLPESARSLYQSLGEHMFTRMVSKESLEEAHDAFCDDDASALPSSRYMWAGSACIPISWLIMFAVESAKPVGPEGILRVDVLTAVTRLREAIVTLAWAALPTDIVDELARTEAWLSPHRAGIVELDYGAAARILGTDDSPRDLAVAIAALKERDTVTAVAAYRRFEARWKAVAHTLFPVG